MRIMIHTSSMVPIYEQIMDRIKTMIRTGELRENDSLPSVRGLAKELRISALTVKKAYDLLEEEGFTVTVHGKGTYVAAVEPSKLADEQLKDVQAELARAVQKGRRCGLDNKEIKEVFLRILEGEEC